MFKDLVELAKYRELLLNLVIRDIKVRYKNSVLGFFWSLANPLLQVATITIVFKFVGFADRIPNYSAYVLCAFLPWTFFQMSVLDAAQSVLQHGDLVKKTYFPREVLPASFVISNLVHFILALGVFFVYLLVLGTPILRTWLLLPVVVLIQFMLTLGVAYIISCLNVYYEDVKYMVTVFLNLLFYLTPIIYFVEQVWTPAFAGRIPAHYRPLGVALAKIHYMNPLSLLITTYRKILLPPPHIPGMPDLPLNLGHLALAAGMSLAVLLVGYYFFNSRKHQFAEML